MDKEIKDMTREELEQELLRSRQKYVWGIQLQDFAAVAFDMKEKCPEPTPLQISLFDQNAVSKFLFNRLQHSFSLSDSWVEEVEAFILESMTEAEAQSLKFFANTIFQPYDE